VRYFQTENIGVGQQESATGIRCDTHVVGIVITTGFGDHIFKVRILDRIDQIELVNPVDSTRFPYGQHGIEIVEVCFVMGKKKGSLQVAHFGIVDDIIIPAMAPWIVFEAGHVPLTVILSLTVPPITEFVWSACKISNIAIPGSIDRLFGQDAFQPTVLTNHYASYMGVFHDRSAYDGTTQDPTIQFDQTFQMMKYAA